LLASVDNLLAAERDRRSTDEESLPPQFVAAVQDAIELWEGNVPGELKKLAETMGDVDREWAGFLVTPRGPEGLNLDHRFWRTLTKLAREYQTATAADASTEVDDPEPEPDPQPYRESVATLVQQNVPRAQICKMFRARWEPGAKDGPGLWDNLRNTPMFTRLEEERANPGSIIGPDFIPYNVSETERRQREQQAKEDKVLAIQEARRQREADEKQRTAPPPQSLADLVAQRISSTQIARMMHTTPQDVERQCREAGLPIPQRTYAPPTRQQALGRELTDAEKRIQEAQVSAFQRSRPEAVALPERPAPEPAGVDEADALDVDELDDEPADVDPVGASQVDETDA
jgi:hypothetical protein